MDFSWTALQMRKRSELAAFGREVVAPAALEHHRAHRFDREAWQALVDSGFWRPLLVFGDDAGAWWDFAAGLEGLAGTAGDGGFVLSVISQAGFIRGMWAQPDVDLRAEVFEWLQEGALTATAIAEPHTGTDISNLKTVAVEHEGSEEEGDGGEGYLLNGEKWHIAHAATALFSLVLGKVSAAEMRPGSLFLVDHRSPGVSVGPPSEKLGHRSLPTSWLRLEEVVVPGRAVLGGPGNGLAVLKEVMGISRIFHGWAAAMLIQPLLEAVRVRLEERTSFGKPLTEHQLLQRKVAEAVIGQVQAQALGKVALGALLAGDAEGAWMSSAAKLTGVRGALQTATDLVGILGSEGYALEGPSRILADAHGFLNVGGSEEAHLINVFRGWLKGFS